MHPFDFNVSMQNIHSKKYNLPDLPLSAWYVAGSYFHNRKNSHYLFFIYVPSIFSPNVDGIANNSNLTIGLFWEKGPITKWQISRVSPLHHNDDDIKNSFCFLLFLPLIFISSFILYIYVISYIITSYLRIFTQQGHYCMRNMSHLPFPVASFPPFFRVIQHLMKNQKNPIVSKK